MIRNFNTKDILYIPITQKDISHFESCLLTFFYEVCYGPDKADEYFGGHDPHIYGGVKYWEVPKYLKEVGDYNKYMKNLAKAGYLTVKNVNRKKLYKFTDKTVALMKASPNEFVEVY